MRILKASHKVIFLGLVTVLLSCQKENILHDPISPADLLTSKEWRLVAHGFDFDESGQLDPEENLIDDCQKDNTYVFLSNGTGHYYDNVLSCGSESSTNFNWSFINDSELEIGYEHFSVVKLNAYELILIHELPGVTTKNFLHYVH